MEAKVIKMEPRLRRRLLPYQSFKCREDVIKAHQYLVHTVHLRGQAIRLIDFLVGHMLKVPGACSLRREKIMAKLGLTEKQYKYALSFLTKRKVLLTHQQRKAEGKYGSCVFVFNPPNYWDLDKQDKKQKHEEEEQDFGTPYIPDYEIPEIPDSSLSHGMSHGDVPRQLSHGDPVENTLEPAENLDDSAVDNPPKYLSFNSSSNCSSKKFSKRIRKQPTPSIRLDKYHCSEMVPVELRDLVAEYFNDADRINQVWGKVEDVAQKLKMDLSDIPIGVTIQVVGEGLQKLRNKQLTKGNTFYHMLGYIYGALLKAFGKYLSNLKKQEEIEQSAKEKEFTFYNWVAAMENDPPLENEDDVFGIEDDYMEDETNNPKPQHILEKLEQLKKNRQSKQTEQSNNQSHYAEPELNTGNQVVSECQAAIRAMLGMGA